MCYIYPFVIHVYDILAQMHALHLQSAASADREYNNWRAGASQPSRTTGTNFLYIYLFIIFGRTGSADIRCLRTHYIHAVYIYSAPY